MKISLIICTYMRPQAVVKLLKSVDNQTYIPNEILIIDGSTDDATEMAIKEEDFRFNVSYFLVDSSHRGLTRQRNFGVSKVSSDADFIAFLDDDLVLEPNYFEEVEKTFIQYPNAVGVGGIDLKDNSYKPLDAAKSYPRFEYYILDGWVKKEPLRYKARKFFGLMPELQPDLIPDYSHGRSGFPLNGKVYEVEHFMGGIATYKKNIFDKISFSSYFEGYGLYEDFDFCVRALSYGKLYVNTNAQVWHYHEPGGRPNKYKYGKMVVRNGWYVWKQRFPQNSLKARFKWHATDFLLAQIRLLNVITGPDRKGAFQEYLGRTIGWFSLWFDPPKIQK
ncbi:glycosyltransferase family 2 protein [Cecembia rubra]|uniref:GT2 family glycosyltransferase n=1 Tax=Cecembia rubra TaxID=1485585 RepID=A0A2P8E3B1_9BACT|nr:glycosyltransferase family 2 protein [Cecembia rubra]PSL03958.1 GT2 family glycosyltransferase [Cecembia rubra]